jgi:hypothetical protein
MEKFYRRSDLPFPSKPGLEVWDKFETWVFTSFWAGKRLIFESWIAMI